jgi:hypothetical protein
MEGLYNSGYVRTLCVPLLPEVDDSAFVEHGVMSPVMRRSVFDSAVGRLTVTIKAVELWS